MLVEFPASMRTEATLHQPLRGPMCSIFKDPLRTLTKTVFGDQVSPGLLSTRNRHEVRGRFLFCGC